jgi:hypothetical protein
MASEWRRRHDDARDDISSSMTAAVVPLRMLSIAGLVLVVLGLERVCYSYLLDPVPHASGRLGIGLACFAVGGGLVSAAVLISRRLRAIRREAPEPGKRSSG